VTEVSALGYKSHQSEDSIPPVCAGKGSPEAKSRFNASDGRNSEQKYAAMLTVRMCDVHF
jgi:hypothetical protein